MKKILSILIALVSTICLSFAFSACSEEEIETGIFYTVTEAYEQGYLTREQVMSIAYYHNGGTKWNEEIMGEDYTPLAITPEKLPAEAESALKQDYLDFVWSDTTNTISDVRIDKYYGTYNGYVAVMMAVNFGGFFDEIWREEVAGIVIRYRDSNNIKIWRNTYEN